MGKVDLAGAKITGQLDCSTITVGADVFLSGGFEAQGKVDLTRARITGHLSCQDGKFLGEDVALNCDAITVGADVFLRDGYEAQGTINLIQADISGNLDLWGRYSEKGFYCARDARGDLVYMEGFKCARERS